MIRVHTTYTGLVMRLTKDWVEEEATLVDLVEIKGGVQKSKETMKKTFDEHCETVSCMQIFHLLDHIVEDLEKFGSFDC